MITTDHFISLFPIFAEADNGLPGEIVAKSKYKSFAAGTQLYTHGDTCPGITFVLSGEIRVYMVSESGREITLYDVLPGETCVLNASCILSSTNYLANAVAIDGGAMLYLSRDSFLDLMERSDQMRKFIFAFFSQRLSDIIELVEEVTFGKLDERLADYLIAKSTQNELQTTHQNIANELGSSREVISRLLKDFERSGRIDLSRHMIRIKQL